MKKRKILFLLMALSCHLFMFSQKRQEKFGKVSREEIKMTRYEKDTLADAVVLFDIGKTEFYETERGGFDIRFTRHKRIKIFDKNKASEFAEIEIPYYQDGFGKTEIIRHLKATTYTLDTENKLVETPLERSQIYKEQINEKWFQEKFVFPNVQDGSVLDFTYQLETPFHFNLPDWTFQDKIPTLYSEYEAKMIPFYEYVFYAKGLSKFDYQNSEILSFDRQYGNITFNDYRHTYVLKDIPAFKDEAYITSKNDYIKQMDFQLAKFHDIYGKTTEIISTWPKLNESFLEHKNFGKFLKKARKIAQKILEEDLNLSGLNEKEKAKNIITYVKNHFTWNGRNSKFASQSAKDLYKKREGNATDVNLFLIAMLTEAKIKSQPIILSTRDHGKIPVAHPFEHFLNYVTVLVNTASPFMADATEKMLPYNMIPIKCFNGKGLVVNEDINEKWIDLKSSISSREIKNLALELNPKEGIVETKALIQSFKYKAFLLRKNLNNDSLKIKEHYQTEIPNITSVKTRNYENYTKPYYINIKGNFSPEKIGNGYMIYPLLNFPLTKNPLIHEQRSYPLDFEFKKENLYMCSLSIPENYTFSSIPDSYEIEDELVTISIQYHQENNQLNIKGNYTFKKSIYSPYEYVKIKGHLSNIVKYFNQPVLVKPKN